MDIRKADYFELKLGRDTPFFFCAALRLHDFISEAPCPFQKACRAVRWTLEGDGHTNSDIPSSTPGQTALREALSQSNRGTEATDSHSNLHCASSTRTLVSRLTIHSYPL